MLPPVLWLLPAILALSAAGPAAAADSALCDRAALAAARETGVPVEILLALTRTETGRADHGTVQPWPWAVNQAGEGHWFADRRSAVAHVEEAIAGGASNIDIGCFQLNYRWHAEAFVSVEAMFEPRDNARYAAGFLSQLFRETGDWRLAAGAFHSRRPEEAASYLGHFDRVFAGLEGATGPVPEGGAETGPRINSFPLLSGGTGIGGSLVPASGVRLALLPEAAGRPLFGP